MIQLPNEYKKEVEEILGQDAERFEKLMQEKPYRGISVNRLKITPEKLLPLLPFEVRRSPFYRDGFYLPDTAQGLGNHPLHRAGAFYVQEPSAASAVSLLCRKATEYWIFAPRPAANLRRLLPVLQEQG